MPRATQQAGATKQRQPPLCIDPTSLGYVMLNDSHVTYIPLWKVVILLSVPVVSVATPTLAPDGWGHSSISVHVGYRSVCSEATSHSSTVETGHLQYIQ